MRLMRLMRMRRTVNRRDRQTDGQTDGHRTQTLTAYYAGTTTTTTGGWLGSRVVSVLDSGAEESGFKSQSRRCRVTVLGKLLTPIVPLFTKQQNW